MNNGGRDMTVPSQQERIVVTITATAAPSNGTSSSNVGLPSEIRPPPLVHAIGGTIGSALSILLCYPLERIRVEMMKSATVIAAAATTTATSSSQRLHMTTAESPSNASKAKSTSDNVEKTSVSSSSSPSSSSSSFIAIETPSSYEVLSEASTGSISKTSIISTGPITGAVAAFDNMGMYRNDNHSSSPCASSSSSSEEEFEQDASSSLLRDEVLPEIPILKNEEDDGLSSSTTSWNVENSEKPEYLIPTNSSPPPFSNTWKCFLHLCKKQELYSGVVPVICTLAISNFIYFYAHEILRQWLLPIPPLLGSTSSNPNRSNDTVDFLSTINTAVSTTTTNSSNSTLTSDSTKDIVVTAPIVAVRRITTTLSTISSTRKNITITKEPGNLTRSGGCRNDKITSRDILLRSFLASAVAGIINVLLTNPLWVANLRIMQHTSSSSYDNTNTNHGQQQQQQQHHRRRSLPSEVLHIIKHEGIAKLWSGTLASLLLVSNPAINHFLYEQLRNYILQRARMNLHIRTSNQHNGHSSSSTAELRPWETFVLGAFTKTVATVITYPLQLAQVVIRVQASKASQRHATTTTTGRNSTHSSASAVVTSSGTTSVCSEHTSTLPPHHECCDGETHTYKGTWDCISSLYRNGGLTALYVGMDAKLLQTVLTAAFTFVTYEQILSLVRRGYRTARLLSK